MVAFGSLGDEVVADADVAVPDPDPYVAVADAVDVEPVVADAGYL